MRRPFAAVLLVVAALAPAAGEPEAARVAESDLAVLEVKDRLASDPDFADAAARRIAESRLFGMLTSERDADARLAAAKQWIVDDPESAARVSVGLERDSREGSSRFEDGFLKALRTTYVDNPNAEHNIFGRLRKAAKDSRLLQKQSEELSADEQSEIMRTLFEGNGSQSGKVVASQAPATSPADRPAFAGAASFGGYYDRLSAGNLRGYSPQLMALQSRLNARRPPGAPALVETGKLDYATLSYPAYGMAYDVRILESRLRSDRILALARASGTRLTAHDWQDPAALEAKLAAKAAGAKLPERLARRAELAAKARAATDAFLAAAGGAKDPSRITKALLVELGRRQKEAARWITAAAIEEELSRIDELSGFPAPELLAAVDAAPVPIPEREAYKRRCEALKASIARVKDNAEKALALLESDAWASSLAEIDRLNADSARLKRTLGRDVENCSKVPFRVAEARPRRPRWREALDDLAVKWAPGLSYSREVAARRARAARYIGVFGMIASGDMDAAHRALAAAEPVRR